MILPPPPKSKKKVRKHLSADALFALVADSFARVPDPRRPGSPIPLRDALMSALAMFSLKDPSLLACHDDWLENLLISASLGGYRNHPPQNP